MIRDLTYASIDWQNDTTPKSTVFDDCYFSVTGGKEETLHNFIKEQDSVPDRTCGFCWSMQVIILTGAVSN